MKFAIIAAMLLVSAFAARIELTKTNTEKKMVTHLKESFAKGNIKTISHAELLRSSNDVPMTTNLDNLVLTDHPSIPLENFEDLQYYGAVEVGSNADSYNFVLDTGSGWAWVSAKGCDNCPGENRFDSSKSTSFETTGQRKDLSYGKGFASGPISYDEFYMGTEGSTHLRFIPADKSKDMEGTKADGIIGLTPVSTGGEELFVDRLHEDGVINKREFTTYIGKQDEQSYIDFGANEADTSDVTYIPLSKLPGTRELIYWSADFDSFTVAGHDLDLTYTSTIWDTGTSLIGFGPSDHKKVVSGLANGKQLVKTSDGFYGVGDCSDASQIDSLDLTFNGHEISVPSDEFVVLLPEDKPEYCFFLLFEINLPGALLGDSFLRDLSIIHDQEEQRLGVFPKKTAEDLIKESA
ncbi:unnamed protein product [Moneuplotes crassus]|uniref:Peptidase A1 domain-containing protein n=1 Tax=Euplotes crassus TaxID=5936 RepID=A0AAD1XFJ7_EUPCR|nr:unnamed protein product [Moneuplotes crassus]